MCNIAIIFAGGVGIRMGAETPKQFLNVYGKPILIHTLEKFQYNENIDKIYVACKIEWIDELNSLIKKHKITKVEPGGVVPGGKNGQDSIYNALCEARKHNTLDSIVLIHDGVRPIIDDKTINDNIESVKKTGSAISCIPAFETPIQSRDGLTIDNILPRKEIYIAKAPQSFFLGAVLEAHENERQSNEGYNGVVDTCNLMMKYGCKPTIIHCGSGNIKVTTPDDYIDLIAKYLSEDYKHFFEMNNKQKHLS